MTESVKLPNLSMKPGEHEGRSEILRTMYPHSLLISSPNELTELAGYKVNRVINHGQYGTVFEVSKSNQTLVLKAMTSIASSKSFKSEIEVARMIQHPHIPKLVEIICNANREYALVFQFCPGVSLFELFQNANFGKLPFTTVELILEQLVDVLTALHKRGIAHGDLKPENILIDTKNNFDVMLIDFGLSSLNPNMFKLTERYVGSARYMAPEINVAFQNDVGYNGQKADIYSLGVITFNMLFADFPVVGADDTIALPPSELPRIWNETLMAMLSILPQRRPTAEAIKRTFGFGKAPRLRTGTQNSLRNGSNVLESIVTANEEGNFFDSGALKKTTSESLRQYSEESHILKDRARSNSVL